MKARKVVLAVMVLLAASMAFANGQKEAAPAADAKPVVLRLAETHPADYPTTLGDIRFADLV